MNVVPKKELGQHFLVDPNILRVIERLSHLEPADVVLEIGPGAGALTRFLCERVAHVHAVEVDRSLEPSLRDIPRTTLHWRDALTLDARPPAALGLDPGPNKLVANLPYNIATPFVVESVDRLPAITDWCVMVQREVADRFFATPGTKAYGAVSVLLQLATARTGFHAVSREVFRPRPNVDSALIAFRRTEPGIPPHVKQLVEASFAHRRKTLANSVAIAGLVPREQAADALAAIRRGPNTRAEELVPSDFLSLAAALA